MSVGHGRPRTTRVLGALDPAARRLPTRPLPPAATGLFAELYDPAWDLSRVGVLLAVCETHLRHPERGR